MPEPRDTYRHGDLRRAVLRASIDLIEKEGLGALSLREVARRIGVTHGAPYHHFPDKASLLRAVAEEGFAALARSMAKDLDAASDPLARLQACGLGYVKFALENPGTFRLMFRPELTGIQGTDVPRPVLEAWETLVDAVERCQSAGLAPAPPAAPARTLANLCWSTVHGLATLWLDRPLRPGATGEGTDAPRGLELATEVTTLLNSLLAAASAGSPVQPVDGRNPSR